MDAEFNIHTVLIIYLVEHKDLKGNESRPVDQRQAHTRVIEQLADIYATEHMQH